MNTPATCEIAIVGYSYRMPGGIKTQVMTAFQPYLEFMQKRGNKMIRKADKQYS